MCKLTTKVKELIFKIEDGEYTGREIFFAGLVLFLSGLVIGAIASPRKIQVFGSGNGNTNYMPEGIEEEDEDEDAI